MKGRALARPSFILRPLPPSNENGPQPLGRTRDPRAGRDLKSTPLGRTHGCFSSRAHERIERDIEVAKNRQKESVMDADAVGDDALNFGDDRAADDSRHEEARAVAR